jgi:hypothetical protein
LQKGGARLQEAFVRRGLKTRNRLFRRRLVARLLSFQKLLQLVAVKALDNLAVNHGDGVVM